MSSLALLPAILLGTHCLAANALILPRYSTPSLPKASNSAPNCTWWLDYQTERDYQDILNENEITLEQFREWNPTITSTGQGLIIGRSYCVEAPSLTPKQPTVAPPLPQAPAPPVPISECTAFHTIQAGDNCWYLMQMYGTFSMPQFQLWNPDIDETCSRLRPGYRVCVGIQGTPQPRLSIGPQPIQSGVTSNCTKFHKANWRENCLGVASQYKCSIEDFYKWNTAVLRPCGNFFAGYHYCVSVS
ncbi:hypothetical protein CDD81_1402 [Ophiocordyceps australis]|uniref:LysM domain-containing protein n=1 Tax=Ophiocordyceps australis TaxID=1399860 RepID=A0A2C5Y065_9HYPO|nr:hypothetical protein CDD81_1402 [Ophiocordyceps australis]